MLDEYEFEAPSERRRHPRTEALSQVQVQILSAAVDACLREISAGGCAVEVSDIPGQGTHVVRLACDGVPPFDVCADLVHLTRVSLPGTDPFFLTGFEFLIQDRATADAIARLIEHVGALQTA